MPRQLRAEQTRATIITAAADLFDRRGYESTSLSDIVAHAQVTKGALYFHFAAKDDLAHAIMEIQSRASRQLAGDVEARGYTSLETLVRITFGIARLSVEGPLLRAGLRLATKSSRDRRCGTRSRSGWTWPRGSCRGRSRSPTSTPTPTWTRSRTRWCASSSARGWWGRTWSRWGGSRGGSRRCGT